MTLGGTIFLKNNANVDILMTFLVLFIQTFLVFYAVAIIILLQTEFPISVLIEWNFILNIALWTIVFALILTGIHLLKSSIVRGKL